MSESFPLPCVLPDAAEGAVEIVRQLADAGHQALLAGGAVRDLLLGQAPTDYDVATDAPPERVQALFRRTRLVGVQFGVVLVPQRGRWIEVATFRSDGPYEDGRHPTHVCFTDARADALRRDFTVNGMFIDPLARRVIDYVGGRDDLEAGVIRAIGDPAARFAEDHLRLLRAVRFAARLGFQIEPATGVAIRAAAAALPRVAAERRREELENMLTRPQRAAALRLLLQTGLIDQLWQGAQWNEAALAQAEIWLRRLPAQVRFELPWALLLADRAVAEVHELSRRLTLSNEQREAAAWLVEHQADLDDPTAPTLAELKRLIVGPAFEALCTWAEVRYQNLPDGPNRRAALDARLASIAPEQIQPPPLVTGADLLRRGVPAGPVYSRVLDELYTRQLNEALTNRDEALAALEQMLAGLS